MTEGGEEEEEWEGRNGVQEGRKKGREAEC